MRNIFEIFLLSVLCGQLANGQLDSGQIKIDLSQSLWTVQGEASKIKVPAKVPGGIYSDLLRTSVLSTHPYYRFNDDGYSWVARDNWTYSTQVELNLTQIEAKTTVILQCEGLDTVSKVFVNGQEVGESENMFRRYSFDIKSALKDGKNEISLAFESPVSYSERKFEEQKNQHYVVPPVCQYGGVCHANHIRKMQSSFSWDWGPSFPSVGIWKSISIEAFDTVSMKYVKWNPRLEDEVWKTDIEVIFECASNEGCNLEGEMTFDFNDDPDISDVFEDVRMEKISDNEASLNVTLNIPENDVARWWPNGYGNQTMYTLTVTFKPKDSSEETSKQIKVAFRELELVQDNLVQGRTFYFRVNGVKFFAKGSNWIPAHALPEQVTKEYIQDLLFSAKEVHMNMLRVWGGGIYELDEFYELADEFGILLWHDFMFACSMYQANPDNLQNVREEIKHQVRRLQHHPSVALWAGNNENELALIGNWYGTDGNFTAYKEDYLKLYVNTIMDEVVKEDPLRTFLVSSPSNGDYTITDEGFLSSNSNNPLYGDTHFYIYNKDAWDPNVYPEPHRFVSEYGFQSFPSFENLAKFSEPQDWSIISEFTTHRQRHQNGNLELQWQINNHMDLPSDEYLLTEEGYKDLLYLMLIEQAESLRTETETYRRTMSQPDPVSGIGMTMGALYWQLNDVWPGASWATLEFGGKWKMSHYYAEAMFAPILISPVLDDNGMIQVYLISDLLETYNNWKLVTSVQKWTSFTPGFNDIRRVDAFAQDSQVIAILELKNLLNNAQCREDADSPLRFGLCFITFRLYTDNDEFVAQNVFKPYPKFSTNLQVPNLKIISVAKQENNGDEIYKSIFTIDIESDQVALYVWLEAIGLPGRFDKNGFHMDSPNFEVKFYSKTADLTAEQLESKLNIRSYKNSFAHP